jgi:hypothetical protein
LAQSQDFIAAHDIIRDAELRASTTGTGMFNRSIGSSVPDVLPTPGVPEVIEGRHWYAAFSLREIFALSAVQHNVLRDTDTIPEFIALVNGADSWRTESVRFEWLDIGRRMALSRILQEYHDSLRASRHAPALPALGELLTPLTHTHTTQTGAGGAGSNSGAAITFESGGSLPGVPKATTTYVLPFLSGRHLVTLAKDHHDKLVRELEVIGRLAGGRAARYFGSELVPALDVAAIKTVWADKSAAVRSTTRPFGDGAPPPRAFPGSTAPSTSRFNNQL